MLPYVFVNDIGALPPNKWACLLGQWLDSLIDSHRWIVALPRGKEGLIDGWFGHSFPLSLSSWWHLHLVGSRDHDRIGGSHRLPAFLCCLSSLPADIRTGPWNLWPTFRSFFENLGEKPFYIAEIYINSTLQIRSPIDFAKNASANCGMWVF